jgi:hypothetical protein
VAVRGERRRREPRAEENARAEMYELRRCRGAAGDESGEARAEMMFEPRRCSQFELSDGRWPSRGECWVDPAGVAVRAEGRNPEARAEWISGEARAE